VANHEGMKDRETSKQPTACPGKTTEQIVKIFESLAKKGNNILATRAEEIVYKALTKTKI